MNLNRLCREPSCYCRLSSVCHCFELIRLCMPMDAPQFKAVPPAS